MVYSVIDNKHMRVRAKLARESLLCDRLGRGKVTDGVFGRRLQPSLLLSKPLQSTKVRDETLQFFC